MPMEEMVNDFQECEPVPLELYRHQVGGHSSILCLDEKTVCKPLIKQEVKFYETLPSSMKRFTPEFRGVIQVRFEEDQDGSIKVAAYPPKSIRYQLQNKKKSRRFRLKNCDSFEIEIDGEVHDMFEEEGPQSTAGSRSRPHNPWVLKCHRDHLSKINRSSSHILKDKEPQAQKFVLLENLTRRFRYPCVLDLKMGTRQYGDDASPAKIQSQSEKAASSTSVQLGVRICGMQVYQVTTGKFICRNKYYGRQLDVNGFHEALCQFLHNGRRLRIDALIPLLERLEELKSVVASLDTYRFYTSSLLLIYEGADLLFQDGSSMQDSIEHPLALVENSIDGCKDKENPERHTFFSKSVENFRSLSMDGNSVQAGNTLRMSTSNSCESIKSNASAAAAAAAAAATLINAQCNNVASFRKSVPAAPSLPNDCVDVRMIDFAHATHNGLDLGHLAKQHNGPDTGYLFGLSNIIKTLKEITNHACPP